MGSQVRFSPRRLGHTNLFVSSLPKSMSFYNNVCGIEVRFREPGIRAGFVSNGNTHHDVGLIELADQVLTGGDSHILASSNVRTNAGLNHLGWEMENVNELIAAYRRATGSG